MHFAKDPHQFITNVPDVKLESPRPAPESKVIEGAKNKIIVGLQEVIEGKVATVHRRGRPATGFDRKEYQRQKAKERRDREKAAKDKSE